MLGDKTDTGLLLPPPLPVPFLEAGVLASSSFSEVVLVVRDNATASGSGVIGVTDENFLLAFLHQGVCA